MCDTTLDLMFERAVAQAWEDQNRADRLDADGIESEINGAQDSLSDACCNLKEAAKLLDGLGLEDRILSIVEDLETCKAEIDRIGDRIKEVRE